MRRMLLLAALAAALAGCGGGDDESASQPAATTEAGGAAQTQELQTDPSGKLAFTTDSLDAKAGQVEIVMTNPSPVPHNIAVKGNGVDETGEIVSGGDQSRVTVTVEAGKTYEFYCSVPGHEAAGMKGDLTVS